MGTGSHGPPGRGLACGSYLAGVQRPYLFLLWWFSVLFCPLWAPHQAASHCSQCPPTVGAPSRPPPALVGGRLAAQPCCARRQGVGPREGAVGADAEQRRVWAGSLQPGLPAGKTTSSGATLQVPDSPSPLSWAHAAHSRRPPSGGPFALTMETQTAPQGRLHSGLPATSTLPVLLRVL